MFFKISSNYAIVQFEIDKMFELVHCSWFSADLKSVKYPTQLEGKLMIDIVKEAANPDGERYKFKSYKVLKIWKWGSK